jgi:hypothetical protein
MQVKVKYSNLILRFVTADFPAVRTVELAILGEAKGVIRLAQGAILNARAAVLGLVADQTPKLLVGHSETPHFQNGNTYHSIVPPSTDKIKP